MTIRGIERRLTALEATPQRLTDWERRKRECAEHTMRQTVETYGHVFHEAEHPGEPYTDECRNELLAWADEVDSQPPHTIEDTLKEYGEIMRQSDHSHIIDI